MTKSNEIITRILLLLIPGSSILEWRLNVYLTTPKYKKHYKSIMKNIGSIENRTKLREKYSIKNYSIEELLIWENEKMTFVNTSVKLNRTDLNPLRILENGVGRCGEYAIVFAALCFANDIEARILTASLNGDHAWNEVKINGTWVHVDPSPPTIVNETLRYANKFYIRVLSFDNDGEVDNLTVARAHA